MDRIDEIDAKILHLLQERGRIKRSVVADEIGMSLPSTSDRIRKLEDRGVVTGYHAVLDPKRIGIDITAFVRVRVDGSSHYEEFVRQVAGEPEILELHSITGEGSHVLKLRTENTTSLERLLSRIQSWSGVTGTKTSIVLSTLKETRALPVKPMELGHPEASRSQTNGHKTH